MSGPTSPSALARAEFLIDTECGCLCRPMGHDHGICGETAAPGLLVPLGPGSAVLVSACPACHDTLTSRERAIPPQRAVWHRGPAGASRRRPIA